MYVGLYGLQQKMNKSTNNSSTLLKLIVIIIASISLIVLFLLPIISIVSINHKTLCYELWFVFALMFVIFTLIINRYESK